MKVGFTQQFYSTGFAGVAMAAMLMVFVAMLGGCAKADQTADKHEAVPVAVMEAKLHQVPFSLEVVGQTEGSREVEVRARVGGILMKRLYQEGSVVKAGQPLFEIDRAPYEIALAQARGQLAEQKARSEQATREAARLKGLVNERAISQKEYDDATSNFAVAAAGMQAAEATVHEAELNLSYATVTAPLNGISGRAEHSEGALISTGAEGLMTRVIQTNPLWVRFGVADNDLAALRGTTTRRPISKVDAILADGSVYPKPGRINFESVQLDRQLGTVSLRAEFDNSNGVLAPGQYVKVRLQSGNRPAMLVPQSAANQTDRGTVVFVVGGDGKAQPRPIVTEGSAGGNWITTSGLKPGEKIILDNLIKIKPGTPVKIDAANKAGAPDHAAAPTTKS